MTTYSDRLTIKQAQKNQPWAVPYSAGVQTAAVPGVDDAGRTIGGDVPHILGTHCVLHAIKSLGKIAAVYEARDHDALAAPPFGPEGDYPSHLAIRAAAADLMNAALRFANLEGFDLAEALVERVKEKNGAGFGLITFYEPDPERAAVIQGFKNEVLYCERCKGCHDAPECP